MNYKFRIMIYKCEDVKNKKYAEISAICGNIFSCISAPLNDRKKVVPA